MIQCFLLAVIPTTDLFCVRMNTNTMSQNIKGFLTASSKILLFVALVATFTLPAIAADGASTVLWITSDIDGYLVGCDCPTGPSAGLSSIALALENRNPNTEYLMDAGGMREPGRSDEILEGFLDDAAVYLGYDGMIAVAGDMRDGFRAFETRTENLPLGTAGAVSDDRLFRKMAGEGAPLLIGSGKSNIAAFQWLGSTERISISDTLDSKNGFPSSGDFVQMFLDSDAEIRIVIVRGGLNEWKIGRAHV